MLFIDFRNCRINTIIRSYHTVDAMVIGGVGCVDECFSGSSHPIIFLRLYTVLVIYLGQVFLSTAKLDVP